jgi:glycosyltransferase involved in cell wall biosynthesis
MRIGIDGIVVRSRNAGTLRYYEQLIGGLAGADSANEYFIYGPAQVFRSKAFPQPANLHYQFVDASRILPAAIQQQTYRSWDRPGKIDLLHSPAFVPPLWFRRKTVMTIFDLTFRVYPRSMKWTGRFWWWLLGRRGIQKADRLIAISENTKNALQADFGILPEKIKVIYPYLGSGFGTGTRDRKIPLKYSLPEWYILYVGTLERRKNIPTLVRAFARARRSGIPKYKLVLAGGKGWLYEDIFRTVEDLQLQQEVIFLGYVPEEDLVGLYAGAGLFVFLSHYEGFGYPLLEAMACGIPVLSSDAASLPEVVGEAGILVPPDDVEQTAAEMVRVLTDQQLHADLVARGYRQARLFSKERFTRQVLSVYEELSASGA